MINIFDIIAIKGKIDDEILGIEVTGTVKFL